MIISIKQTGGFAGSIDLGSFDTRKLGADSAQRIESLVRDSHFFEIPSNVSSNVIGADIPSYSITVNDDGRSHTVTYQMGSTPQAAQLQKMVETVLGGG